ncbi:hypothetical protein DFH09DRAFT_412730 [Mycena vulgaris]|nr:hypothetical protein DFH09DRAFT_412730 [Mycena vulgaris]
MSSRKPTCKLCRQRKIRCDAENPCGPCSRTRTAVICEYPPSELTSPRLELPKGAACIPCRQRKRKCDGKRPCCTCNNRSRSEMCQYRDKASRRDPGHRGPNSQLAAPESSLSDTSCSIAISEPLAAITEPVEDLHTRPDPSLPSHADLEDTGHICTTLHTSSTPQDDQAAELFSIRNLFLDHCWTYGLNVSPEKREAMARGDTSGAIVHPIFIHVCQLLGYLLASRSKSARWGYLNGRTDGEAEHGLRVLQMLDSPAQAPDPLTCIQVYTLLALYCALKNDARGFQEFLGSASNVALRHAVSLGLEDSFTPEQASPCRSPALSPSGPVEEARSALAHLVYLEMATSMVMEVPPALPPVLLVKFRRLAAKHRGETEANFVQANSIFLLMQTQKLVAEWDRWEAGTIGMEWSERYCNLANNIQAHLQVANSTLVDSRLPKMHSLKLKTCVVILLAALAELYAIFAPFNAEAWRKHSETIGAVASITRQLSPADHDNFDCTFEVCLGIVAREIVEQPSAPQWKLSLAALVFPSSPIVGEVM